MFLLLHALITPLSRFKDTILANGQVQGRVLLPGAAMLEMASSAGGVLLSATGSTLAASQETHCLLLLGVSIPSPLILPPSVPAVLSVTFDTVSGQSKVQSRVGAATVPSTHLAASYASAPFEASAAPGRDAADRYVWKMMLSAAAGRPQSAAVVVANVVQGSAVDSAQYTSHPTIIDNCIQVREYHLLCKMADAKTFTE